MLLVLPISSTGNVPWCQPCNNGTEHFLTWSHTCCQQAFASSLVKLMGKGDCESRAFLAMLGPQHLGKLHKVYAFVWEMELSLVTAAMFQQRPEATGKGIKASHRPLWQSWVPGIWSWRQLVPVRIPADSIGSRSKAARSSAAGMWFVMELILLYRFGFGQRCHQAKLC